MDWYATCRKPHPKSIRKVFFPRRAEARDVYVATVMTHVGEEETSSTIDSTSCQLPNGISLLVSRPAVCRLMLRRFGPVRLTVALWYSQRYQDDMIDPCRCRFGNLS